jgi:hypothetical protein
MVGKGIDITSDTTAARFTKGGLERLLSVQRPVVLGHLKLVRKQHPTATPADVVHILEQRYLAAVTTGGAGSELVQQLAGEASGTAPSRAAYWGEIVTRRMPKSMLRRLTTRIRKVFIRRFAARQGASVVLRVVPFGIGAVIGGTGNHLMGRKVIDAARDAFGPAPVTFPGEVVLETPQSADSVDDPAI